MLSLVFERHFSPFHFYINRQYQTALILNPKVASTFLRQALAETYTQILGYQDASDGRYRYLSMARRMPLASGPDFVHFLKNTDSYDIYSVVRHPVDRAISAWTDKFYNGFFGRYPRSMRRGELKKARDFAINSGLEGGKSDELFPFDSFIAYIESGEDGRRNHHWDLQSRVLFADRIKYKQVFQVESQLAAALATIFSTRDVPQTWFEALIEKPINSNATKSITATESQIKRLERIYREDYQRFGYTLTSPI